MSDEIAVRLIRKSELRDGDPYADYDDPLHLAPMAAAKREALLANPLSESEDDPVQLLGLRGRLVTGRLDLVPGQLIVGGEPVRAMTGSSLFVPPEFRATGTALVLLMKMQSLWPVAMATGVSQLAYPIYSKLLRWVDFAMPRYVLLRRSRVLVERFIGSGWHSRALSSLLDVGLAARQKLLWLAAGRRRQELEDRPGEPPAELDTAFARLADSARYHRSVAWLRWLLRSDFSGEPHNSQSFHGLYDASGTLVAYYILKVRFHAEATHLRLRNLRLGSLADWLILEPSRVDDMTIMLAATRALANLDVDAIEVCTQEDALATRLRAHGFVRAGELRLLFKASTRSPLGGKRFHEIGAWRLRPCEGDHFFT